MEKKEFEKLDLNLDEQFFKRCDKFIKLLQQWGKVHNLTASLKYEEIEANILDSVYPLSFIETFKSFADVGTGAGYPGMLLAIARPDVKAVLIEPRSKRVAFLNFVKSALKLENLEIIQSRVEELDFQQFTEETRGFDLITSRAVSNTSLLLELTQNISDDDTSYLFYKGSLCEEEIKNAQLQNYEVKKVGEHRNYLYMKRKGLINGN
ncbi:MAG: 16S rRNA (guanine(527)-N(7))-methyltransferase RsmG [Campylobacterota bacterium]|nr:16S rRNA (guanine(527)-N(7))-methyltransferase RsmG [Campylobacterota bacterium]